jgi:hypothetical protein
VSARQRRIWERWEMVAIDEIYPEMSTKWLATFLGCSITYLYRVAAKRGLHKSERYLASSEACRLRRGDNVGRDTRFKPGQAAHNKGVKMPGWAPGRMRETQFTKGQHPHNWVPIGSTRLYGGYLQRKIADTRNMKRDWRCIHVMLWEEAHGPIPAGRAVIFKDRDKANIVLENLELVTREELMIRNSSQRWGPEVFGLIQLRGALNRKLRRKEREEQNV